MRERFQEIYATNEWKHGSGEGSLAEHNQGYIRFVESFFREHDIRSIVDLGCGDWQFSRHIDWQGASYLGMDIVPAVIEANRKHFSRPGVEFMLYDGNIADIPPADLLITKDVLQHWSHTAIHALLPALQQYRHVLVTNCVNPHGPTLNDDIPDGGFRYLDLRLAPFHLPATEVFSFTNRRSFINRLCGRPRWLKKVLHLQA
ncbi:MAG: methyltransferase domain-containing protein [Porticoccaceae bacterium]